MGDTRNAVARLELDQGGRVVMGGAGMLVKSHGLGVQAHRHIREGERFQLKGSFHETSRPVAEGSCVLFSKSKYLWLDDVTDPASRINTAGAGGGNNMVLKVRAVGTYV
jgi:hypothetical protein